MTTGADTDRLEATFVDLVASSWQRHAEMVRSTQTDDLLVGALIAASVAQGWALIDLGSNGRSHQLRFDHAHSRTRLLYEVHSMAETLESVRVLGKLARIEIGFGTRVDDFARVFQAVKTEIKSAMLVQDEPGVITVDGDLSSGYVYAQMSILVDIDDYLTGPLTVDYPKLQEHTGAVIHSLSKYLRGRLGL